MKDGWLGSRIARLRAILVAGLTRYSTSRRWRKWREDAQQDKLSLLSPFPNLQVGGRVDEVFDLEAVAQRWLGDLCGSGVELVSIRTASSS